MEAVPRMPMVALELKHSLEYVDFGPTLKQYIRDHYGEDPALYNKAVNELEQLRQSAIHVSHDFMGCSTLKKYFAQLQFLQGRFPMTEGGESAIPFTWEDVHSGREVTLEDIKFEQACVLYNIGSLHSVLGAMDTRQSADGMKVSCTHFQCASWAFEYLRDHFGCAAMSLDMSHEVLTFQVSLMLAQAQECILEKSMTDSRKSTITAKVAAQIVEFYKTTLKNLDTCHTEELISSRRYKDWKKRIDIKVLFYTCITNYYMGRQSEDQQKWGQCLAYYTQAQEKLNECHKLAKGESQDILESLKFTNDVVGGKYQAAKKDNDFVYHDKVPAADSLPEVKGASLVKGIPFNPNDPEVSGPDIFQKLVPMSAHEASSLYSEEKASLLRRTVSEISEKNEELQKYMDSLQLDPNKLNPEQERLPQQLLEKCAALSVRPNAIKDLVDSMGAVSNVATDVDLGLKEIQSLLDEETKNEEEFQSTFGKRSPNMILGEIAKEFQMFEAGHRKGSQSNTDLHKAMNTHINNLKLLSSPLEELQQLLPSLDKAQEPENADIIKDLNMLLGKIDEMKTQRSSLEDQLRKDIHEDDITNVLVTREGVNREVLFSEQLKKHEQITSLIRQNLSAQGNILRALTDANAKYATVRKTMSDTIARRDQTVRDLINSYDVYEDLMAKSQKGLEFYKKLETNVGRLLARCRGVCKVQQEEREQITNRYKPKAPPPSRPGAPKPSLSDTSTTTPAPVPPEQANPQPHPTVPPMFEGPKLKDYLPFMKPKTFGKKDVDGIPDIPMDPAVAAYMSRSGSLPNSGTASPVQIPGPSSLPASPDHYRFRNDSRIDGLDRLRQPGQGPQIGYPDLGGPTDQGQGHGPGNQTLSPRLPQSHPEVRPTGQPAPTDLYYMTKGQGHMPQNYIPDGPSGPKMRRDLTDGLQSQSFPTPSIQTSGVQNIGQQFQSHGQGQQSTPAGPSDQYVPLNQKWKQEGQGSQIPPVSSLQPIPQTSQMGIPRSQPHDPQVQDRHNIPLSVPGMDMNRYASTRPVPSSSPLHSTGVQSQVLSTSQGQGQMAYSQMPGVNTQSVGPQVGYNASLSPRQPASLQQPQFQSVPSANQFAQWSQAMQGIVSQPQLLSATHQPPQIPAHQQQLGQGQQPQLIPTQQLPQTQQVQPGLQQMSGTQQVTQLPQMHLQQVSQQPQIPAQPAPPLQNLPQQHMIQTQQQIPLPQQGMVQQQIPPISQQQQVPQQQIPQQQQVVQPQIIPQSAPQQQHVVPQQQPQQQSIIPQQGMQQQQVNAAAQQQITVQPQQIPLVSQPQQQVGITWQMMPQQGIQQPQQMLSQQTGKILEAQQIAQQQPAVQQQIPQQQIGPGHGMQQYIQPGNQQIMPQQIPVAPQPHQGSPQHQQNIQQLPQGIQQQQGTQQQQEQTPQPQQFQQIMQPVSHQYSQQVQGYGGQQQASQIRPDLGSHGNIPEQQVLERGVTNTVETVRTPVISPGDKAVSIAHSHTPQDHSGNISGLVPVAMLPHQGQGQMMTQQISSVNMGQGQMQVQGYGSAQVPVQGQGQQMQLSGQAYIPSSQIQGQGKMTLPQGQLQTSQGSYPAISSQIAPQTAQSQTSGVQFQPQGQLSQNIGQGQVSQQPRMIQPQQFPQQQGYQQAPQSQPYQQPSGPRQPFPVAGQPALVQQTGGPNQTYLPTSQAQIEISQPFPASQQQLQQPRTGPVGQQIQGQWQSQVQGQLQGQMQKQNQGQVQPPSQFSNVPQGQIQGQISSQSSVQMNIQIQGQVQGQSQFNAQNQQPRLPAPPYSQTGLNRAHTQQIMSQSQVAGQTSVPVGQQQQTGPQGQGQMQLPGNQQMQYNQGQGQQNVQGQQIYGQQMGMTGYQQGMVQQQVVQPGFQGQGKTQGQPQGQVTFSQIEQAQLPHLPSPLQPKPASQATASGQGHDTDQVEGQQVLSEGQGQTITSSNVPPLQQTQSKQDLDKALTGPTWSQGAQQEQNVPKWTPLNLNVAQEPAVPGRGTYPGQGKSGSVPGTPVQGEGFKSPLSSVKSTPTHSRENSQGKLPESTSSVSEPLPGARQLSTTSSLDEILSSSPDGRSDSQTDNVLAPKVLTAQEIQQQKEDLMKDSSLKHQPLDPYKDKTKLDRFVIEVEKLAKFIEGFEKPTCSGPTPLDFVWKEVMEEQDKAVRKQSLAIARCYPMKNREQDIMPYDNSRVVLTTASDDYINASWINDLSPSCPKFVATQSPLPVTLVDFWCMVYEQGVEVLVTLSSEIEVGKKYPVYWPEEKGKTVHHGSVHLTLQSKKEKPFWTERIIHLTHSETRSGRTLVHLHYNAWPVSGFPDKVSHILQFITEVHSFYRQQRSLMKPVLVHCSNGIGRSGTFMLIYVGMQNINYGNGIINLAEVGGKMLWKRRNLLLKKDQMKYCYEAVLYYAQDILAKQGILVHKASFGDRLPAPGEKAHTWEPGEDILFGSMSLSSLQSNVEKFGVKSSTSDKHGVKTEGSETVKDKSESYDTSLKSETSENLDEKLQRLKEATKSLENETVEGELVAIETDTPKTSDSLNLSNLPDVVQRPSDSLENKINKEMEKLNLDNLNIDILGEFGSPKKSVPVKDSEKKGSVSSLTSLGSDQSTSGHVSVTEKKKSVSLSGSPLHKSRESSQSPVTGEQLQTVSASLADLQDPNTFTIGTSPKGRRKITKDDFLSGESTIDKQEDKDQDDPLSTLDPLWSLK